MASPQRNCYHIENETAVGEGKGGGGWGLRKMQPSILFSAHPHFLFRFAVAVWAMIKNIKRMFSA